MYYYVRFSVLTFLVVGFSQFCFAGAWGIPEGMLRAKIYGAYMSAPGFRDLEGNSVNKFPDSLGDINRRNVFELDGYLGGLYAEYGLTSSLSFVADLPFGFVRYRESRIDGSFTSLARRASTMIIPYYGIGARYNVVRKNNSSASVFFMSRLPQNLRNYRPEDSTRIPFLNDGVYQTMIGLEFGTSLKENWFEGSIKYNNRTGPYEDELLIHAEAGFSRIQPATMKLFVDVVQSMAGFDEVAPFSVLRNPWQENFVAFGVAFNVMTGDRLFLEASYNVRLFGRNSWNIGTFAVGAGLQIPQL